MVYLCLETFLWAHIRGGGMGQGLKILQIDSIITILLK